MGGARAHEPYCGESWENIKNTYLSMIDPEDDLNNDVEQSQPSSWVFDYELGLVWSLLTVQNVLEIRKT